MYLTKKKKKKKSCKGSDVNTSYLASTSSRAHYPRAPLALAPALVLVVGICSDIQARQAPPQPPTTTGRLTPSYTCSSSSLKDLAHQANRSEGIPTRLCNSSRPFAPTSGATPRGRCVPCVAQARSARLAPRETIPGELEEHIIYAGPGKLKYMEIFCYPG